MILTVFSKSNKLLFWDMDSLSPLADLFWAVIRTEVSLARERWTLVVRKRNGQMNCQANSRTLNMTEAIKSCMKAVLQILDIGTRFWNKQVFPVPCLLGAIFWCTWERLHMVNLYHVLNKTGKQSQSSDIRKVLDHVCIKLEMAFEGNCYSW